MFFVDINDNVKCSVSKANCCCKYELVTLLVKVRLLNIEWCRVINEDVSVSIHYPE